MKSSRNTARQLFALTLTLVGLLSWNTLPIHASGQAVQAATRASVTEPTGQQVSRAVANGRVAFVSSEGNAQSDIYTMNPDGSDRKQLTFGQENEREPVWSPDGTKIAFAKYSGSFSEIFVMNADGSDQRRLTQSKFDQSHTWSPDGTQIAFWRMDNIPMSPSSRGIFVMNADGSDQRAVASTSNFLHPAWSPDGLKLAVTDDGALGTYGIYLINVDGSNRTQITQPPTSPVPFEDHDPAWSPDGSKITFTRCDGSDGYGCWDTTSHLWVVNADGSNPTQLTDTQAWSHAWSPDGTKIIFANAQNSGGDLLVMNPDGSGLTNITNTNDKHEQSPSWQALPLTLPNPIDDPQFFVRQHYRDFLSREPDADGLAFWTNEIALCGADQSCIEAKRINVSAAFFLSIEFQETGYLVYRMYKSAYGNLAAAPVPLTLNEFLPDTQKIGQGVIVNQPGWETVLENNKQAFTAEFVQRSRFTSAYPTSLTPDQFVDQLFMNAGVTPSATDRQAAINEFGAAMTTNDPAARARSLRRVAENSTLAEQEFNRAFVLMQYFGYLRRNPNDAPELGLNFDGYNFWLNKLNQFNGSFRDAEMVKAFLVSTEYRQRFGP